MSIKSTEKIPKLINQGKYGCIYKPGVKCSGKLLSDSYISKIQKIRPSSLREADIGSRIRKIKNYIQYFAPIISSCPLRLSVISKGEIQKCDVVRMANGSVGASSIVNGSVGASSIGSVNGSFVSDKMRYVGDITLGDHLTHILTKTPDIFFREITMSHQYLLQSLVILQTNNLVHYDLKENNII